VAVLGRRPEGELQELEDEIRECRKCELWRSRKKVVPGEGSPSSGILVIGEAPGYTEDLQGRPFVGAAGRLLGELLCSIGLERGEVYVTNVVKCRPPGNREPTEEEIGACTPYLEKQLELLNPRVILLMGRIAASHVFRRFGLDFPGIGKVHGKVFRVSGTLRIVPMYHPAAALYNPGMKKVLEEDFLRLREELRG